MSFISAYYLFFLLLGLIIYYLIPDNAKKYWLLILSFSFYALCDLRSVPVLLWIILIAWGTGKLLDHSEKCQTRTQRKWILAVGLILYFSTLIFCKYAGFFSNVIPGNTFSFFMPLGLSFYTLTAAGYCIDIYRKERAAENNPLILALFIAFFPLILSGPIERSKNLIPQLYQRHPLRYESIKKGIFLLLWGFFVKIVIADRLAVLANAVYDHYTEYTGLTCFFGILAFSLQIYCDFSGYSLIAIGSARLFDITIMDNFHSPYLSRSVREFWRRWHISLSTWFRDYLYIPLGGGRVSSLRKAVNVLIVFSISGLWHGADFTFFLWGTLNGLFQVIEGWIQPKISRFENHRAFRLLSTFITFFLITYAWVFFRSESLTQSYQIFTKSLSPNFTSFHFDELLRLGLDLPDSIVLLVSLLILFLVDQWRPMENFGDKLWGEPAWVHLIVFTLLLTGILVFGFYGPAYDAQNFIYAQF